jgi:hypothetical protein
MEISPPPIWPRPRFQPGGGNAMVFYALYGRFPAAIQVSGEKYRTAGVPQGVRIKKVTRQEMPEFPFTGSGISRLLQPQLPDIFAAIQEAPECLIITGEVEDPSDLNYLRDVIGLTTYFLDEGGEAVIDPQKLGLYSLQSWHQEIFDVQPPKLLNQVVILVTPEPGGTKWIHTRGLRKFGRPDLSIRSLPADYEQGAIELCNRLIILQAEGTRIPEGEEIEFETLPYRLTCHHAGDLDDPDYNNVHVEIRRSA